MKSLQAQRRATGWHAALRHFRRSLLECGSDITIEHAQRVGMLLSQKLGDQETVRKWASLFSVEGIPACSMIIKALVAHNDCVKARQLILMESIDCYATDGCSERTAEKSRRTYSQLVERLCQLVVERGRWQDALHMVHELRLICPINEAQRGTSACAGGDGGPGSHGHVASDFPEGLPPVSRASPSSSALAEQIGLQDSLRMSCDSAFVPREHASIVYCGIASVIVRSYPHMHQWRTVTRLLSDVAPRCCGELRVRLYEHWAARLVVGGRRHDDFVSWTRAVGKEMVARSGCLLRMRLRCAIVHGAIEEALECLERVRDGQVLICQLAQVCEMMLACGASAADGCANRRAVDHQFNVQRLTQVLLCARGRNPKAVGRLLSQIANRFHVMLPPAGAEAGGRDAHNDALVVNTLTALDRSITALVKQGEWSRCLRLIRQADALAPTNSSEKIIAEHIKAHRSDWKLCLSFFL